MEVKRIVAIVVFTAAVGLGYAYGLMKRNVLREEVEDSDVDGKGLDVDTDVEGFTDD